MNHPGLNILVSGSTSGLGKHFLDHFKGKPCPRDFEELKKITIDAQEKPFDVIIHSAFNLSNQVTNANVYQYMYDNLFLTKTLAAMPHSKFIFISEAQIVTC